MNANQAEINLKKLIEVRNQNVTYAKGFFLKNFEAETRVLIANLLKCVDAEKPSTVIVNSSVNIDPQLKDVAKYVSWKLAAKEAIWGLISNNFFVIGTSELDEDVIAVDWTTVVGSSGGQSSTWYLNEHSVPVPKKVCLRPSGVSKSDQPLSDPDLFMHELDIEGMNKDIESSLREAVLCFKNELYLACLTLLGRAAEGAWIELGKSLVEVPITSDAKLKKCIYNQFDSIGKKVSLIVKKYEEKGVYGCLHDESGVSPLDLKECKIWSDVLRNSRNSIHYNVAPFLPNKYEKVSALLINSVANLKTIFSIINSCRKCKI